MIQKKENVNNSLRIWESDSYLKHPSVNCLCPSILYCFRLYFFHLHKIQELPSLFERLSFLLQWSTDSPLFPLLATQRT